MVPALSLAAPFWKGQPLCGTSTIASTAQMPCGRNRRLGDGACRSQLHILRRQQYHPRPPYPLSADRFRHDPWSPDVTHAVRTPTLSPPTQMAPQRCVCTQSTPADVVERLLYAATTGKPYRPDRLILSTTHLTGSL